MALSVSRPGFATISIYPLGGNRLGAARTYFNLFITMVLGGLWHGANWTFVLWGMWHGGLLAAERLSGVKPNDRRPLGALFLTLLLVVIGWVMFRAENVGSGLAIYAGMLGFNGFAIQPDIAWQVRNSALFCLAVGWLLVFVEPRLGKVENLAFTDKVGLQTPRLVSASMASIAFCALGFLSILKLTADNDSPFLYFQF